MTSSVSGQSVTKQFPSGRVLPLRLYSLFKGHCKSLKRQMTNTVLNVTEVSVEGNRFTVGQRSSHLTVAEVNK